ncbi:hypothetical protein, partial [Rhizobium pisi]|uniref:hypothetical protein n=1 Tax=Rhizobium pisi TaxID=574561 RepID=UPI003D08CD32
GISSISDAITARKISTARFNPILPSSAIVLPLATTLPYRQKAFSRQLYDLMEFTTPIDGAFPSAVATF